MKLVRFYFRLILMLLITNAYSPVLLAQTDTTQIGRSPGKAANLLSVGTGIQHGFIFPHSKEVQNTKGARPTGVEVILSWQSNDASTWNLCNCYPRKGLLLTYYDFDKAILGKKTAVAYFLEPTYQISQNIFLSFQAVSGLAYLTHPFDSIINPSNQSYSTFVNGYLAVGVGAWFWFNEHWWLNPSVNYQHISNGGMKKPNKGINWPTAGVAISYQPQFRPYYTGRRSHNKFWQTYSLRWDAGIMGTSRRGYDKAGNRIRSPLLGIWIQAAKQVGSISNLTLGVEAYQDEELRNQLSKDTLTASPVKAGLLAGHEFILGKFLFSQRLGYYIFDRTPYFDRLHHRWGLHYRLNQQINFGFDLLAHRQVAEYVDLRLSYSFQNKSE